MKHESKYLVTQKQKYLLKKLGCTTWDKKRNKKEASRLIAGYLQPAAMLQVQQDSLTDAKENKQAESSYSLTKKQYWEDVWKSRALATREQRIALKKMGYLYWDHPLLTFREAQEKCRQLWQVTTATLLTEKASD